MRSTILDNVVWHSLRGAQARFATGTESIRRYAPGFSGIVGAADPRQPDFAALGPYCAIGEPFYFPGWAGAAPDNWTIQFDAQIDLMVWDAMTLDVEELPGISPLGYDHVPQILELVALTRPGPFGQRTIELGEYFGVFEQGRLIAMAGERMAADRYREVSGVCTHPDFQGRGLARGLMNGVIRRQLQRGQTPFLHVMAANVGARRMYERMGFRLYCRSPVRVVVRTS